MTALRRGRFIEAWWPTIFDATTAKKAGRHGAYAAFLAVGVGVFFLIVGMAPALTLVDMAIVAGLGLMILRMSRAAAVAALVVCVFERLYAYNGFRLRIVEDLVPLVYSVLVFLVILLGLIAGVRGTFAYHQFTRSSPPAVVPPQQPTD